MIGEAWLARETRRNWGPFTFALCRPLLTMYTTAPYRGGQWAHTTTSFQDGPPLCIGVSLLAGKTRLTEDYIHYTKESPRRGDEGGRRRCWWTLMANGRRMRKLCCSTDTDRYGYLSISHSPLVHTDKQPAARDAQHQLDGLQLPSAGPVTPHPPYDFVRALTRAFVDSGLTYARAQQQICQSPRWGEGSVQAQR